MCYKLPTLVLVPSVFIHQFCFTQNVTTNQNIGVIDAIPYLIESKATFFGFNGKDTFSIGAGRFRVFQFQNNVSENLDQLIQLNKPQKIKSSIITSVSYLSQNSDSTFSKAIQGGSLSILNNVIKPGEFFTVNWLNRNRRIIQKVTFKCLLMKPNLLGYRSWKNFDSLDQIHKARYLSDLKFIPLGFKNITSRNIQLNADENIELKFEKRTINIDSTIYYRVLSVQKSLTNDWTRSGHLLTLSNLPPNKNFIIEVKYANQPVSFFIEIKTLKKFYQDLWFIALVFLILITLIFSTTNWYYRRKIRKLTFQRNRVEDKLKMLQSQLNPHFVFNALSSIEGLVTAGENELANQYLANFSLILRQTLRNMDKILLSLEEELNLIDKYCKVEQLRFGFQYKIVIGDNINKTAIELPPLLLQPIVENAIKHGLAGLGKNGYLEIAINQKENNLEILVKNNRTNAYTYIPTAGGFGLKYLNQRIVHFNQLNPDTPITYEFRLFDKEAISIINFQNCFL